MTRKKPGVTHAQVGRERAAKVIDRIEYQRDREARTPSTPSTPHVWRPDDPLLLPFYALGPNLVPCERGAAGAHVA